MLLLTLFIIAALK